MSSLKQTPNFKKEQWRVYINKKFRKLTDEKAAALANCTKKVNETASDKVVVKETKAVVADQETNNMKIPGVFKGNDLVDGKINFIT